MTLAELLESKFRGDIRFRGQAYVQAERVALMRITADRVTAVVRDGVEYQVQLLREDGALKMACSCAGTDANRSNNPHCKHLWATILTIDSDKVLSGSVKPGYIPPFSGEPDSLSFDADDWDDGEEELPDVGSGTVIERPRRLASGAVSTAAAPVARQQREWEAKLQQVREAMADNDPTGGTGPRDRQIFYEVDVPASEEAGQLILQTSQRQRRANGEWGKLKPLKLRPGKFDEIDDENDRRILAHLLGGLPDRAAGGTSSWEGFATVHRFRVPHDLVLLLLPGICQTERVRVAGEEERVTDLLQWDEGAPFELNLAVDFVTEENMWRVIGTLRRDDTTIGIREPALLLPGGLMIHNNIVSRIDDFDAFAWASLLRRGEDIAVPAGEELDLVERLLEMPALPRLKLPTELTLEEVNLTPQPILVLHPPQKSKWQQDRLRGEVLFQYDDASVRGSSGQWAIVQQSARRWLIRNRPAEQGAWSQLQDCGFRRLIDQRRSEDDVELAARELGNAVRTLMNSGWQIRADGKDVRQPAELRFQVRSGIDWFELHADVDFGGHHVGFPELLAALARGDTTVQLDDGSLGVLPEEWIQRYGLLSGLGVTEEDHVRFSAVQVGLLDALLSTQPQVDYDERFLNLRSKLQDFNGITAEPEPASFKGELRSYQREGVGWLRFLEEFHFGGCLADDMGLGKTIQLIAFLEGRRLRRKEPKPSLVVVPKSLLFNWTQECERFTPQLRVLEYSGLDRADLRAKFSQHDLIVTTYGTLRRDVMALKDIEFDYVVLDEAQAIKNASSQVAKASRLLKAEHRLALSGTPIENHLGDLCSIFDFLNPGMLGRSTLFKLHAADPEDRETRRILADGLRPLILRRTKRSVASELPEKLEQTILCEMGEEQERLYLELRDHYRDSLLGMIEQQGLARTKLHVLEALLRLRQAACHPALLQKGSDEEGSAKLEALCPQLEELIEEGHKALVFSQFTSMLAIVRKHLDQRNIVHEYLDGQTRDRKERVERFQNDPSCGVFLISLKAGGLGLNLTAADYVFILDPWWNPAVEAQAIDRAHRVGQTKPVFAYRLICKNTVEEKIAELQQHKRELAEAILQQDGSLLQKLTTDDLKMLFS